LTVLAIPRDLIIEEYEEEIRLSPRSRDRVAIEAPMSVESSGNLDEKSRKLVWLMGVLGWINSACIVSCCQVGCPMLLEVHFNWSTEDLARGMGVAFLCTAPLFLPLLRITDVRGTLCSGLLGLVSIAALVPASHGLPQDYVPYFVLGVSAVLYALTASGTSLFIAAGSEAALPGSIFSTDNLIILTYADGAFILSSAIVSRRLIFGGGVFGYATILAALVSLQSFFALLLLVSYLRGRRAAESSAFPFRAELSLLQR
jgi:hypothetical protein